MTKEDIIPAAVERWVRQPTTLTALAVAVGAAVYWHTHNAVYATMATSAILGTVSDHTAGLLKTIENLEDQLKSKA
jgi:hypothetical protein